MTTTELIFWSLQNLTQILIKIMVQRFIPTIGITGHFRLSPPFEIPSGEIYSCKAIRKISEHRSLGVDVYKEFYQPFNVTEAIYNEDNLDDAEIISLLANGGKWVNVPSRFILGYPDMNGIPYHGVALHIALPAFQVSFDFTNAVNQIKDAVMSTLGVSCVITTLETTRSSLVPSDKSSLLTAQRRIASERTTPASKAVFWKRAYEDAMIKNAALTQVLIDLSK